MNPRLTFGLVCALLLLLQACRKHSFDVPEVKTDETTTTLIPGLPEKYDSVNAFFFAAVRTTVFNATTTPGSSRTTLAIFAEPAQPLFLDFNHYSGWKNDGIPEVLPGGNIAPGVVLAMGDTLRRAEANNFTTYFARGNDSLVPYNVLLADFTWYFSGNKSFQETAIDFSQPFAVISDSFLDLQFRTGQTNIIHADSLVSPSDSIALWFVQPSAHRFPSPEPSTGFRSISSERRLLTVHPEEIVWLENVLEKNEYTHVSLCAFRYYHKWEKGRLYVFEFSTERRVPLSILK